MKQFHETLNKSSNNILYDIEVKENPILPNAINYNELIQHQTTSEDKYTKSIKENYQMITENPLLGIIRYSPEGRITYVNDAICGMLGYLKDEIKHIPFGDFSHPDDLEIENEHLKGMFNGETDNFEMEKRYITKQKGVIWVKTHVSCLRKDGKIKKMIGVLQNITERKLIEEEFQKSEANLSIILNH